MLLCNKLLYLHCKIIAMVNVEFKSMIELVRAFPDEQSCIAHLEELRWNGVPVSPFDANSTVYKCKGNKYRCRNTGKYFNVRTSTMFDNTKVPLQKWFLGIWLVTNHKKGISSIQLSKDIDVTQKTAWFMLHRIRQCFGVENNSNDKLDGIVEVDETFVGGKAANMNKAKRATRINTTGYVDKVPVVGFAQRNGTTITKIIKAANMAILKPLVIANVDNKATLVTDGFSGYKDLNKEYDHVIINHSANQYAKGEFHTNTIEGFWSLLKRSIYGIYHSVSPKHLAQYLNETTFRYNTRKATDGLRFSYILVNSNQRLTYKSLIQK